MNFVWAWCAARIEPERFEEWEWSLNQPLPGREKKVSATMIEDEGASFMAMMGQMQKG